MSVRYIQIDSEGFAWAVSESGWRDQLVTKRRVVLLKREEGAGAVVRFKRWKPGSGRKMTTLAIVRAIAKMR